MLHVALDGLGPEGLSGVREVVGPWQRRSKALSLQQSGTEETRGKLKALGYLEYSQQPT
jgi:hypothetical protein